MGYGKCDFIVAPPAISLSLGTPLLSSWHFLVFVSLIRCQSYLLTPVKGATYNAEAIYVLVLNTCF